MNSLRMCNFRSFRDTGEINFLPITVFVGGNSSGKSSILRSFPLFRQSYSSRVSGPILWYSKEFIDFNDFYSTKNKYTSSNEMSFSFSINKIESLNSEILFLQEQTDLENVRIDVIIEHDEEYKKEFIKKFNLFFYDHVVNIELNVTAIEKICINDIDYSKYVDFKQTKIYDSGIILEADIECKISSINELTPHPDLLNSDILNVIENYYNINDEFYIPEDFQEFGVDTSLEMQNEINGIFELLTDLAMIEYNETIFKELNHFRNLVILNNLSGILNDISLYVKNTYLNMHYIAPVRANAERYYRIQNSSIDEVNPSGDNLAMFINNLSKSKLKEFQKWTKQNYDFKVTPRSEKSHIYLEIDNSEEVMNLADTGFGYSQLLPIITQLWFTISSYKKNIHQFKMPIYFIVEQPELHLHPKLQHKLMYSFVVAVIKAHEQNMDLRIVLETHSKTIVESLGDFSIVDDIINPEFINIYVVDKKQHFSTLSLATIAEDGSIENWPFGFFNA